MAFNPFHGFRKHQKAWFAGLTVMSMLTFVACAGMGGGDMGTWILKLFGSSGGEPVARMYGKTVTSVQVANLRVQREAANQFMISAVDQALGNRIGAAVNKLDRSMRQQILQYLYQPQGQFMLGFLESRLNKDGKREQAKAVGILRDLQPEFLNLMVLQDRKRYFQGSPDSDEELFEFLLWRHEADRLNVQLTDDGVMDELKRATFNQMSPQFFTMLQEHLRTKNTLASHDWVMNALRDEFRVRLAQRAFLDYRPGPFTRPVTAITPDQFWEFFKEKRAEFQVDVLPVPVEGFLDKVTRKPTEKELRALFDASKNREKDPESDKPGFKHLQRVEIKWLTGDPESEKYHKTKEYKDVIAHTPDYYKLLASIAATPGQLRLKGLDLDLYAEYEKAKGAADAMARGPDRQELDLRLPALTEPNFVLPFFLFNTKTWNRPQNAAALVGRWLADGATGSPSAGLALSYEAAAVLPSLKRERKPVEEEIRKRTAVAATLFLAGTTLTPGAAGVAPSALPFLDDWNTASRLEQYLPLEAVKGVLVAKMKRDAAHKQMVADFMDIEKKLAEYRPEDKGLDLRQIRVPEILAEAAEKHGLTIEGTRKPVDRFDIADDPNIQALKQDYAGQDKDKFTNLFFQNLEKLYLPQPLNPLYKDMTAKPVLWWRTEVVPAKVPATLDEVRPQVVQAWRLEQAHKLAKAEAERLAKRVKAVRTDGDRGPLVKDLEEELRADKVLKPNQGLIYLWKVAPLIKEEGRSNRYRPFTLDEGFTYPRTDEWVKTLLGMENAGREVQILENRPRSVYYLAVRTKAPDRTASVLNMMEFREAYKAQGNLWDMCQEKYAGDYYTKLVRQMKERAKFEDLRSDRDKEKQREKEQKKKQSAPPRRPLPQF